MKARFGSAIAGVSSLFAVVLAGDEAKAFIIAGEQFTVACYGSAPATCDSQRAHWQTTNWTAGWNRYPGTVALSGQLPVAQTGAPLFVRGSFTAGNSCRYVVTNPDGALVSTNNVVAPFSGVQTLNLGNPVVPGAHALSVLCNISQDRWIGAAWQ
jgi:hypothetical protein